jgi:hypothetical protein
MGIYSIKENLYAEFAEQKTKPKKVKWLQELRVFRETHPQEFRGNKISIKNIDNLITVWSQKSPGKYAKDLLGITAREERERLAEMAKREPKDDE